jgi:hypothetical protein
MLFAYFLREVVNATNKDALKVQLNLIEPNRGLANLQPKARDRQIEKRKAAIEKTLDDIFLLLGDYDTMVSNLLSRLSVTYDANSIIVQNALNNVISGNSSNSEITGDVVRDAWLKGDLHEYTLMLKDTTTVKQSAINNYKVFTRSRQYVNIVSDDDSDNVETTTQLYQYLNQ